MNSLKILVVEDNETLIEGLRHLLEKEGFIADMVTTKKDAMLHINKENYDLILLDVQLPDGSGFDICKYIKNTTDKPVIFISGRGEEMNVVYGLDIGADDYITKPFGNDELKARINCIMRRYNNCYNTKNIIIYRNIKADVEKFKVYKDSEEIFLTTLEYKIFLIFLNNVGKLITREELLAKVWDIDANFVNDNTLSVYIKRVRRKIGDNIQNQMLKTIRGVGYILNK